LQGYSENPPSPRVLNEDRYFEPAGGEIPFIRLGGKTVGVVIGETICCEGLMPDVIVNPVASPFAVGRGRLREEYLSGFAREHGVAVASVNCCGGKRDLVFDGRSAIFDARGTLVARGAPFEDDIVTADLANQRRRLSLPTSICPNQRSGVLWFSVPGTMSGNAGLHRSS